MKIVLITTGQPSCNPRIVKEADSLSNACFDVTVLYSFFIQWAQEKDEVILKNVSWKYIMVGGHGGDNKLLFFFTRLRFKISRVLNKYVGNKFLLAERAQARTYDELLYAAKKIKADWYIGHNLGALSIAVKAATFNGGKAGFDFEDYHRGENNLATKEEISRIIYLENTYVTQLNYISAASPLIAEKIGEHFPLQNKNIITLLNCFPLAQQPAFTVKAADDKSLQLFWFSQTIGLNRGLEVLIEAMKELNDSNVHLTLAGRCNEDMLDYIKTHAGDMIANIHFAGIILPELLPAFASKFDVGIAIELFVPVNRNICLTNKIFTYLLAGNAIILTETAMQLAFNKRYHVGESIVVNKRYELTQKIKLYKDIQKLNTHKLYNYELAKTLLNWDQESKKLVAVIKRLES